MKSLPKYPQSRKPDVLLLDTSGSMNDPSGARPRIEVMRDVLREQLKVTPEAEVWEFNSLVRRLSAWQNLQPSGGTYVARALAAIAKLRPDRLVLISDGCPSDDPEESFAIARAMQTMIHTIFVGDEHDFAAIAFLRALSWCSVDGFGTSEVHNLARPAALSASLRLLLTHQRG